MSRHSDRLRTYGMSPDRPRTWMDDALCGRLVREGRAHPDWWFPDPSDIAARERARAACRICPVRDPCLADGEGLQGMWGGVLRRPHNPRTRPRRAAS